MQLDEARSRALLTTSSHGVLCTLHPVRGVDAVPVMFAVDDAEVVVPVDTVKAKRSTRLQRAQNLQADPRATLLVEHWDAQDWSTLWWVRVQLHHVAEPDTERLDALADRLAGTVPQYRDRPFAELIVLRIVGVTGWSASER